MTGDAGVATDLHKDLPLADKTQIALDKGPLFRLNQNTEAVQITLQRRVLREVFQPMVMLAIVRGEELSEDMTPEYLLQKTLSDPSLGLPDELRKQIESFAQVNPEIPRDWLTETLQLSLPDPVHPIRQLREKAVQEIGKKGFNKDLATLEMDSSI